MPENIERSNLELTTDLKVQDKHEMGSCKTCQSRSNNWFVNVQSPEVQRSILQKQRDTSKVWNEIMDNIWKGKVSGSRVNNNGKLENNPEDIICVDDIESDVEETGPPVVFPTLSPITNVKTKVPSSPSTNNNPNSTPTSNNKKSKSPHPKNVTEDTLLSLFETIRNATLSPAMRNTLIYSYQTMTDDHVFWVRAADARTRNMKQARLQLTNLKTKISDLRKANVGQEEQCLVLQQCLKELEMKELGFAKSFIKRVYLEEYHGKCTPLSKQIRNEIQTHRRDLLQYIPEMSAELLTALQEIGPIRACTFELKAMHNKFTPLLENELYYKERRYWEKHMESIIQSKFNQISNTKESPALTKQKKKTLLKERIKEKRRMKKAARKALLREVASSVPKVKALLREVASSVPKLHNNETVETSNTADHHIPKDVHTTNVSNLHQNNHTRNVNTSFQKQIPVLTSGNRNQNVSTPKNMSVEHNLTILTGSLKQTRFRPYKRLLDSS